MSIPFTQYLMPDGRPRDISVDRSAEIEALAQRFMDAGGKFEAECLSTGEVSFTACTKVDGEMQDIACEVCANGPGVGEAVDKLVREAVALIAEAAT